VSQRRDKQLLADVPGYAAIALAFLLPVTAVYWVYQDYWVHQDGHQVAWALGGGSQRPFPHASDCDNKPHAKQHQQRLLW
jgi:hypothetical protein